MGPTIANLRDTEHHGPESLLGDLGWRWQHLGQRGWRLARLASLARLAQTRRRLDCGGWLAGQARLAQTTRRLDCGGFRAKLAAGIGQW